jgi:hypothetical protein
MAVLKNQKAKHSVGFALGRGENEVVNQRLEWILDTWLPLLAMLNQRFLLIYICITQGHVAPLHPLYPRVVEGSTKLM